MELITISGVDGSGKSTQIKLLQNHLESKGKKVFYFHAIEFGIAQKITAFRNKYCPIRRTSRGHEVKSDQKSVTKANWMQIQLRKAFLHIDISRFKHLYGKLGKDGFDFVLSDRYFFDTLINIAYLESELKDSGHVMQNMEYNDIPEPDHAFYLNADPEKIMSRDRVPDQGLAYLEKKKGLLDIFSERRNLTIIDGNKPKEEIFNNIKSQIGS